MRFTWTDYNDLKMDTRQVQKVIAVDVLAGTDNKTLILQIKFEDGAYRAYKGKLGRSKSGEYYFVTNANKEVKLIEQKVKPS